MRRLMSPIYLLLPFFLLVFTVHANAADTFTVSIPAGTEVTMQDPNAILPITIANQSTTKNIRQIEFAVDTTKYIFNLSQVAPPGWCVSSVAWDTLRFALLQPSGSCSSVATASQIAPGASLTFNITVIPQAAAQDVTTDTLKEVVVQTEGGFTLSGSLPTWTRRSLALFMTATPQSTGVGGSITLAMQVTNRSTATQSTIGSTPDPPTPSSAIVTKIAGPYYGSTLLNGLHDSAVTTITVNSTTDFPLSGAIKIDSEEICYTGKTATTFTGVIRGCNGTTPSSHAGNSMVWGLTQFSLISGSSGTITYIYRADSTGSVYFTARATNASGTAKSVSTNSNTVVIGAFTAAITASPVSVVSGLWVTVTMTVTNNGQSALVNIVPALSGCAGGASEGLVSGPSPSSVSSLAGGDSAIFQWTYQITGTVGQVYCFTGSATANGPISTNTATSNTGAVSSYSVTLTPSTIVSGATNVTLTWNVFNGGGCPIKLVEIDMETAAPNWAQCTSATPPAGWTGACGAVIRFTTTSSYIQPGQSKSFSATFPTTETVTSDKVISTPVQITAQGCGGFTTSIAASLTITAYGITLTHSPAGPIYADGTARYTMTATLTTGGSPVSGKTITFTTTNGTIDTTCAGCSTVTDSNGRAIVQLIAPNSTTNTSATVTAAYINATTTDTVNFTGFTGPNLQYWGLLNPASVNCGSQYSFTMNVKNIGTSNMTITTASYFAFNDGTTEFKAYLNSGVTIVAGAAETLLTFGSPTSAGGGGGVTVNTGFTPGTYSPTANPSPPPAKGLFFTDGGANSQYRDVTDSVTVGGPCGAANIIILEWREMY